MSKVKQLNDELNVFYSKENSSGVGGVQCLTSSGALFLKDLGKRKFHKALEVDWEVFVGVAHLTSFRKIKEQSWLCMWGLADWLYCFQSNGTLIGTQSFLC